MGNFMKPREAADKLGVAVSTLDQWRWQGRGPLFVKVGRLIRYREEDLEAFGISQTFSSTTAAQQAM
jgi:predicted site-specific integrase-resolvase